jgi:hypothetical protein
MLVSKKDKKDALDAAKMAQMDTAIAEAKVSLRPPPHWQDQAISIMPDCLLSHCARHASWALHDET